MYQTRPDDYAAFQCLAGACPQTCCAAWEIVVDPDAQDAYLRLQHPLAAKLRRVLRVDSEGDTYFAQTDGRCPFLCADGLCELQRTLGEQSLCRTCRDFPRWEVLLCDRVEQGLSPACPEAARRLLERSAPLRFVSAPLPDDGYVPSVRERRLTAAVTAVRDRVLALLARPEALISIGDHAFNDLMPISAIGGQTLWIDPYPGIHEPEYTWCVHTLAELAAFLDTIS